MFKFKIGEFVKKKNDSMPVKIINRMKGRLSNNYIAVDMTGIVDIFSENDLKIWKKENDFINKKGTHKI